MKKALRLHELVCVNARFTRSISLVRDFDSRDALNGYILTPIGRDVLDRLDAALSGRSATRAWSLTGPYGAGKSAFALLLSQLVGGEASVRENARALLANQDWNFSSAALPSSQRLLPVLVGGSRRPMDLAIAGALADSLRRFYDGRDGRPPKILRELEQVVSTGHLAGASLPTLFEEADAYLARQDGIAGILLVVDELGKFLEFGASNPERGDVFVLQELAEAASRSRRPLVMVTILHQAIDQYAEGMAPSRRAEWSKVQGRFEDVAFEERSEHVLRLLSRAVRPIRSEKANKSFKIHDHSLPADFPADTIRVGALTGKELGDCLRACYPLHPLTTLVLGPLFGQIAQNERSIFAFLSSSEPHGFQDFLRSADYDQRNPPSYRLDMLHDYLTATLGSSLYHQHRGKVWAEIDSALQRLDDASPLEVQVAKVIGLLQAVGPARPVAPSAAVIRLALREVAGAAEVDAALRSLQDRSIAIYRKFASSYALWEGSDIDLDACIDDARRQVHRERALPAFLTALMAPEPMIARRHYFKKGTLRYFEVCYADADGLAGEMARDLGQADGRVIFCLPLNADESLQMASTLRAHGSSAPSPIIAALPGEILDLEEQCHDIRAMRWVLENVPELESDQIARKELHGRLTHAERRLKKHLEWVFTPLVARDGGCSWFNGGQERPAQKIRDINYLLSTVCDEVYRHTPTWRNELINRRSLSSAAAAARRDLIDAMIRHQSVEGLGFKGVPPERCMYETLLKSSGLHREQGGAWGFFPPAEDAEDAVREVWATIERYLAETESGKLPLSRLFDNLRRPPIGLKDGVLPVLFAAALLHHSTEVALYEDGTFVPRLTVATFERLFRSTEPFEVQRYWIAGARSDVFRRYAEILTAPLGIGEDERDLIPLVKPLGRMVMDLPDYVGRTQRVSEAARRLLKAIKGAQQPDRLLFEDIPSACGFPPFKSAGEVSAEAIHGFFTEFRDRLEELRQAYPSLVGDIQQRIRAAFGKSGTLAEVREQIEHDARLVTHLTVEPKLKAFLNRLVDRETDDELWLESIGSLLASKAPSAWNDEDLARFEINLTSLTRSFKHFCVLAFEQKQRGVTMLNGDPEMLRVSVTLAHAGEFAQVVAIPLQHRPLAEKVRDRLRRAMDSEQLLGQREIRIAILAQLVQQTLAEETAVPQDSISQANPGD